MWVPTDSGRLSRFVSAAIAIAVLTASAAALAAPTTTATRAVTISPRTSAAAKARCPRGTRPAFGGFKADYGRAGGALPTGMGASGRVWRSGAANSSEDPHAIRSFAYCSKHARFEVRSSSSSVPASAVKTVTATCPRRTQLLAGGYRSQIDPTDAEPVVLVTAMRRSGRRSLAITAVGIKLGGRTTAIAYCGEGPRPAARSAGAPVPGDLTAKAVARCPRHRSLVFGGFVASAKLDNPGSKLVAPGRIVRGGGGWAVTGVNLTQVFPGRIAAIAYCS